MIFFWRGWSRVGTWFRPYTIRPFWDGSNIVFRWESRLKKLLNLNAERSGARTWVPLWFLILCSILFLCFCWSRPPSWGQLVQWLLKCGVSVALFLWLFISDSDFRRRLDNVEFACLILKPWDFIMLFTWSVTHHNSEPSCAPSEIHL